MQDLYVYRLVPPFASLQRRSQKGCLVLARHPRGGSKSPCRQKTWRQHKGRFLFAVPCEQTKSGTLAKKNTCPYSPGSWELHFQNQRLGVKSGADSALSLLVGRTKGGKSSLPQVVFVCVFFVFLYLNRFQGKPSLGWVPHDMEVI